MKKKIFAALLLTMVFALQSRAQVQFGLKGGLNVSHMSVDKKALDASNRAGFFVGPTVKITLPVVGLGIDASALYDQRSTKFDVVGTADDGTDVESETVKQQQIAIPINLRYGFGLGETASIYFFAGPQFGFNVGDKEQSLFKSIKDVDWKLKSTNFSVNVGLGAMLLNHLQLSANYNIACGKTGDLTVLGAAKEGIKTRNNAWQIGLAYYF